MLYLMIFYLIENVISMAFFCFAVSLEKAYPWMTWAIPWETFV
jgi:hypothetical protein